MADSPEVAALKEQAAKVNAQRELAKAELELLQAQKSLTDARAVPTTAAQAAARDAATKASAEAQKALFDQQKAASDAQAAATAAQTAAIKAKVGSVDANAVTPGTVTTENGAGNAEASLLAALVVQDAAERIASALKGTFGERKFVIYTGSQRPTFDRWRAFQEQRAIMLSSFDTAEAAITDADAAADALDKGVVEQPEGQEEAIGVASIGAIVTAAGAALDAASKIASFFQSSFKVSGATVSGSDDELLAVAVARHLPGCFLPSRWLPISGETTIVAELDGLVKKRDASNVALRTAQSKSDAFKGRADAETDATKKGALVRLADAYLRASELFAGARKRFDEFLASLGTNDKDGVPLAVAVLNEKLMYEKLDGGAVALILRVNAALGGSYTKANLWTFFGSMPFFVSGGCVATYLAIDGPGGSITAAGEFALHSGYHKVSCVAEQFQSPAISPKRVGSDGVLHRINGNAKKNSGTVR